MAHELAVFRRDPPGVQAHGRWAHILKWIPRGPWTFSLLWSVALYLFLSFDDDPWTELHPAFFSLFCAIPMIALTIATLRKMQRSKPVPSLWKRISVCRYATYFYAFVFLVSYGDTALRSYDPDCYAEIGSGNWKRTTLTVYQCSAVFQGAEQWLLVRPTPAVGSAYQRGEGQTISVSDVFPARTTSRVFESPPVQAVVQNDGNLDIRFADGTNKLVFLRVRGG